MSLSQWASISCVKGVQQHYCSFLKPVSRLDLLWCQVTLHLVFHAYWDWLTVHFGEFNLFIHIIQPHLGNVKTPELSVFKCWSASEWPLGEMSSCVGVFLCLINDLSLNFWFALDTGLLPGSIWCRPAFPSINPSLEFLVTSYHIVNWLRRGSSQSLAPSLSPGRSMVTVETNPLRVDMILLM